MGTVCPQYRILRLLEAPAIWKSVISLFPVVRIWKSVISEYADRWYTAGGKDAGIWRYSICQGISATLFPNIQGLGRHIPPDPLRFVHIPGYNSDRPIPQS